MRIKTIIISLSAVVCSLGLQAADAEPADFANSDSLSLDVEAHASLSNGRTPLWLNANKYGVSSLNSQYGYARFKGQYSKVYSEGKYTLDACVDAIVPVGFRSVTENSKSTTHFLLQQAYVEGRYALGELTVGAKQQPMELKNNLLSSGSQTLGINARPIPQVRIGLHDYWTIPYTRQWLSFKGHMAYGVMTDGAWEEEFAKANSKKYNKGVLYHQKAGYLRIGNDEKFPLSLTAGLEMACQFGGTGYDTEGISTKYEAGIKTFFNAFVGGGFDKAEEDMVYKNTEGNQLGSWVLRLDWKKPDYEIGLYADHFFEDHSAMFFLGNDGYGEGEQWNERVKNKFFLHELKDFLVGLEVKMPKFRYVNDFVVEYINTRYQSGPVYHDHTQNFSSAICGMDNYYNHFAMPGWQHAGQVIGNPLYLSPLYNEDGTVGTKCNRFYGWHFGFSGNPCNALSYRTLISWQQGLGNYESNYAYEHPRENLSVLIELEYSLAATGLKSSNPLKRMTLKGAWGADWGKLRGDNSGFQFTLGYHL